MAIQVANFRRASIMSPACTIKASKENTCSDDIGDIQHLPMVWGISAFAATAVTLTEVR